MNRPRAMAYAVLGCLLALTPPAQSESEPIHVKDDLGYEVRLQRPAQRIISLAPHITEMLGEVGALPQVVGVTSYSDYPEEARKRPQVGGYHQFDLEAILALKPDLVVAWHSGNPAHALEKLKALGLPVYVNEPRRLHDIAKSLRQLGKLAGQAAKGNEKAQAFEAELTRLAQSGAKQGAPVRVFYQIWNRPLMTVNGDHLISDVIRLCGGENVFSQMGPLSASITEESVLKADPDIIVASGMEQARPEWLDAWKRWPSLWASTQDQLYFIPPDLIQRHSPRVLQGAALLCDQVQHAKKRP
jgi:iron complex transport system substrate-binding protein